MATILPHWEVAFTIIRMYPILGRYGQFFIYSYTIMFAVGILAGMTLTARLARRYPAPNWMEAWLLIMIGALLGGRLFFVGARWDYFQQRPYETYQLDRGGLSYLGALLGGLLFLWLWARWQKRPFTQYANLFSPALVLICAAGWLACYLEGCAYGRAAFIGLLAADLPDDFGVFALRYQTQLIGLLLKLILFLGVLWLWRRGKQQNLFWITLCGLSLIQLIVTLLRGDPTPQIGSIRLDTLFNLVIMTGAGLILLRAQAIPRRLTFT